jgi:transcriptional regulator GlxA family with amidase domain
VLLAVPHAQSVDITGPADVFHTANLISKGKRYSIELVSGGPTRTLSTVSGIDLVAHCRYRDLRGPIDTFLVAGGVGARQCRDAALLRWIARTAPRARRYGSVCTGTYLLAAAGLLKGRRVSTHWAWAQDLATRHPEAKVDPHPIWIQDGSLYTSAGVTAGMDLSLNLVEQDLGPTVALEIARYLVLFLRRPGGQAQFSSLLSGQSAAPSHLRDLPAWILEHLRDDLRVESLAAQAAMSSRHFSRVFTQKFELSPARYVEQIRLESARSALELSEKSVEQVAQESGFGSAEAMRKAFQRLFHTSPARYRERFLASQGAARSSKSRGTYDPGHAPSLKIQKKAKIV